MPVLEAVKMAAVPGTRKGGCARTQAVRQIGAQPRFWCEDRVRLSLQSWSGPSRGWGPGVDACLGGSLVPGAGWITFDPANRSVGGFNLIPVAVGRDIRQAMPVAGSSWGRPAHSWAWRSKLASKLIIT